MKYRTKELDIAMLLLPQDGKLGTGNKISDQNKEKNIAVGRYTKIRSGLLHFYSLHWFPLLLNQKKPTVDLYERKKPHMKKIKIYCEDLEKTIDEYGCYDAKGSTICKACLVKRAVKKVNKIN